MYQKLTKDLIGIGEMTININNIDDTDNRYVRDRFKIKAIS